MNCKNCGSYIENPTIPCPVCGIINVEENNTNIEQENNINPISEEYTTPVGNNQSSIQQNNMNQVPLGKQQKIAILVIVLAMIALIVVIVVFYKPTIIKIGGNNTNGSSNTVVTDDEYGDDEEDEEDDEYDDLEDAEDEEDDEIDNDDLEYEDDYEYTSEDLKREHSENYINELTEEDIKEYYDESSEKIISITPVSEAKNILSEKEIVKFLKDRGFEDLQIQYSYDMNGKFLDDITIKNPTNTKHPCYNAYYISDTTGWWTLFIAQDKIYAYAVQKTLELAEEGKLEGQIHLSESKEILSYDSSGNKYYLTIPKKTTIDLRVVKKINKKTLDNYKFD